MSKLHFYFDENVDPEVAHQLKQKGVEAISVRDLQQLGDKDRNHLQRAHEMGYVLCTHDQDFLIMNAQGIEHAGIIYVPKNEATIGGWVREILKIHQSLTTEDIVGQVKFVNVK